jgi:hypothetical protein
MHCCRSCRTTAEAPTTSEAASSSQTPVFNWSKQWYPVLPTSYAEDGKPHGITLLDRQFVVWKDGSGTWRANEDFCPHRCVLLQRSSIKHVLLRNATPTVPLIHLHPPAAHRSVQEKTLSRLTVASTSAQLALFQAPGPWHLQCWGSHSWLVAAGWRP